MKFNRYLLGGTLVALGTEVVAGLLLKLLTAIVHSYWHAVPVIPFWHAVGVLLVATALGLVWAWGLTKASEIALG